MGGQCDIRTTQSPIAQREFSALSVGITVAPEWLQGRTLPGVKALEDAAAR